MARRFRGGRGSGRSVRVRKNFIWVSLLFDRFPVTDTYTDNGLVIPGDWVRSNSGFEKGAVLQCVRGWLDVVNLSTSTIPGASYYAITAQDEDSASISGPGVVAHYNDEDVLWCGGVAAGFVGTAQQPSNGHMDINVNTKRKLTSDSEITFSFQTNNAAVDHQVSGVLRALLSIP